MTASPPRSAPAAASSDDPDRGPGHGVVEAIHITPAGGDPMQHVDRVRAIAGAGLAGDRYASGTGHYSGDAKVDRHVTLIEVEEIEALEERAGLVLGSGEMRRNITTRGIRLNDLVGRQFQIGDVLCEATRLCEPCGYLEELLGKPILEPLVHRAGLRAKILTGGEIALGDEVVILG